MKRILTAVIFSAVLGSYAQAGIVRTAAKLTYKTAKFGVKATAKTAKLAVKVLY